MNIRRITLLLLSVYALAGTTYAVSTAAYAETSSTVALREMARGNWDRARAQVQQARNPTLGTLYEWMLYRENLTNLPFDRVANFIKAHPDWPEREEILATAERNMPADYPNTAVLQWFQSYSPVTGKGLKRYLDALVASGQQARVQGVIDQFWPTAHMDDNDQRNLLSVYGRFMNVTTQQRRLDHLLFDGDDGTAKSLAAVLGKGYPQLVEARIALSNNRANASALVERVPSHLANDAGLLFERLKWRRKNEQDQGAITVLDRQPRQQFIVNPEDWWKERNILVRRMIEKRNYREAYRLAKAHDQMEGQEYADAEWLAGWLALRFINKPQDAYGHFNAMYGRVKSAISKARAAYWAGRAADALGQKEQAQQWYKTAAQFPKVYYGQLAALKLPADQRQYHPVSVTATAADKASISQNEMVKVIRLVHMAGLDGLRRKFINAKVETLQSPGEFKAFAEVLSAMGLRHEAVRVAKKAAGKNIFLDIEAYPKLISYFSGLQIDGALAHAVIRQESEFDQYARSPSGALGLMQLMPRTAAYVAKQRGWGHQTGWLTSRPEHNVLLGSAYLNDLLDDFGGSYPLVLAAYNAGGSRVREWLRQNGDPRTGRVDWIDWIELIPIYETRNYVQRVMESYVVYNQYMQINRASNPK